jgi:predicted GH43/DUF377 family glycosyl hydrolase
MKSLSFILLGSMLQFIVSCHPADHVIVLNTIDSSENWALVDFRKLDSINPILDPGENHFPDPVTGKTVYWEKKDVFNPAVVVRNDTLFLLYRAQDSAGTSRIGLAWSTNGTRFTRYEKPVLYPANDVFKKYEWPGGCEDPRVVQDSAGTYYMTYTAFDGKLARLFVASSTDLLHWHKKGSVFTGAPQQNFVNLWSKSGSIVSAYRNGKIIATRINGKYWMYWGDQFIWCASSTDLIHWSPVLMNPGEKPPVTLRGQALNMPDLKIVVPTRKGKFDCDLVESGPPAMLTDKGILLLYNSRNIPAIGDSTLPEGTYAPGEAVMDPNDPVKLMKRLHTYFLKPDKPYELSGQVNHVCFLEGLAQFRGQWFLYYGTADSKIAVAVSSDRHP